MRYLSEFRSHWRAVVSAGIGLATGLALNAYAGNVFGPYLIEAFGWAQSDFALMGALGLVTLVSIPLAGRLTDMFGARRVAAVGVVALPLTFLAFTAMNGEFSQFFAIMVIQNIIGSTTTSAVYSRLVAGAFDRARGLALAFAVSAPAVIGALSMPVVAQMMEAHGWRAGYYALAGLAAVGGALALLLAPRMPSAAASATAAPAKRSTASAYKLVFASLAFWVLFGGMFLCNIPSGLATSQLALVLVDNGVSAVTAATILSGYATGVIIGRFSCGVALDHLPSHLVAAVSMSLPAIGMFILASNNDAPLALSIAIFLLGLSQGAEGDMLGFLVARYFGIQIYGTVVGLLFAAISGASAVGAFVLRAMLQASDDSYAPFLTLSGVLILIGGALFLFLGKPRQEAPSVSLKPA